MGRRRGCRLLSGHADPTGWPTGACGIRSARVCRGDAPVGSLGPARPVLAVPSDRNWRTPESSGSPRPRNGGLRRSTRPGWAGGAVGTQRRPGRGRPGKGPSAAPCTGRLPATRPPVRPTRSAPARYETQAGRVGEQLGSPVTRRAGRGHRRGGAGHPVPPLSGPCGTEPVPVCVPVAVRGALGMRAGTGPGPSSGRYRTGHGPTDPGTDRTPRNDRPFPKRTPGRCRTARTGPGTARSPLAPIRSPGTAITTAPTRHRAALDAAAALFDDHLPPGTRSTGPAAIAASPEGRAASTWTFAVADGRGHRIRRNDRDDPG